MLVRDAARLLDALDEPAAVCRADGGLVRGNSAWRRTVGGAPPPAPGVFEAFVRARRGESVRVAVRLAERAWELSVAPLAGSGDQARADRLLARLHPPPVAPTGHAAALVDSPFPVAEVAGDDPWTGALVALNPACATLLGAAAQPGGRLADLLSVPDGALAAGREATLKADPETALHVAFTREAGGWRAWFHDVSEIRRLRAQLGQRHKLEGVGRLAGGVAHDFNNLLTAIGLRAGDLLQRHPLGDPAYDSLSEIRDTVIRAGALVNQLLTFSSKATVRRERLDVCDTLRDFEVMLRRLVREDVTLTTVYGRDTPAVRADRSQIETAVMNLVVNARDAARSAGGGAVRLRVARVSTAEAAALGHPDAPEADMALIEVADDGPGVPPEALPNLFQPFFTTKPLGEGTGLGLATVHGIVQQSGGAIAVRSPPGEGATFRIFLPAWTAPLTLRPPAPATPTAPAARDLSGAGRILFVEDEPLVRGIAARLLRARGYEVLEAGDGEAALALAEAHAGAIDLMISDVIMPGLDGPALLRAARPHLGAAPVMFISGYAESDFSDLLEGETDVTFLPKPLDINALAERVKRAIHGA